MCKKLLSLILVLALASAANAVLPSDDFESPKTVGDLHDQGGGVGFSNNWQAADTTIDVDSETGNQYWRYNSDGSDDSSNRLFTTALDAGGQYTIYLKFRASQKGGNGTDEWATNTPGHFQLREDGGKDPLHLKVNQSNVWMLNDGTMMGMDDIPDWYTAGGHTQEEIDDYYENYVDNWADWKFDLDLTAQTVAWYWMDNSSNWDLVGTRGMGNAGDVTGVTINRISLGGKINTSDVTQDFDDFSITPEPATIMLLGLGGLALIRKKR
jgi:hypothetical protein